MALLLFLAFIFLIQDEKGPSTYVFPSYKHTYGIRKAGATELFMLMGLRVSFGNPQGLACVRLDAWEDPDDPHDDDEVTVYGVNSGENNIIFNKSMWALDVYGTDEEEHQQLNEPHGICANSRGDVYIADSGNNRIVRLYNPGHSLEYVSAFGSYGDGRGSFNYPKQVCMDSRDNIYVSDTKNDRVQVFNNDNEVIRVIGGFTEPNAIAVTDSMQKHSGNVSAYLIVIDSSDQRISQFSLDGRLLARINTRSLGLDSARLAYACIDYYNQIIITDLKNHCLHKLDKDLNYLTSFGRYGEDDNEFVEPRGIAIYRRFGQLFVAEKTGAQYFWVGTDIDTVWSKPVGHQMQFSFIVTEPSYITADIIDSTGHFVGRLLSGRFMGAAGERSVIWNGRVAYNLGHISKKIEMNPTSVASAGKPAPRGRYTLRLTAEATYSSRTYFEKTVTHPFNY